MNKLKYIVLIISFFAMNAVASNQAIVLANTLNVRESYAVDSKIVGKLQKNEVVQIVSCDHDFCKIESSSVSGYVSEKYLNKISASSGDAKKTSSDGWGCVVFIIMAALGVMEFGFKKKIGCIAAASSVVVILSLWLLLEIFQVGSGCEAFLIVLTIVLILLRNRKASTKCRSESESFDSNAVDCDQSKTIRMPRERESRRLNAAKNSKTTLIKTLRKKVQSKERTTDGSSLDAPIKLLDILSLGSSQSDKSEKKEILYCQWTSSEYGQRFYDTFSRWIGTREVEKVLERKYGKGRLSSSSRAKVPPSWYELGCEKEVLYCQWTSSEYGQRFYGTFSRWTGTREVEKVLERQYGKGRLSSSSRAKNPPSWYEL